MTNSRAKVNSRSKGKRVELDVAHRLGTKRNPADGHSHTDLYYKQYAIELKARAKLPVLLHSAMAQAAADLGKTHTVEATPFHPAEVWTLTTPLVILVETRTGQKPVRYVLSRFEDFFTNGEPDVEQAE